MTDGAEVHLGELRRALTLVLDAIEQRHGEVVDLQADYYWAISPWDAFRFDATGAPEPTAGRLTDDVPSMRAVLKAAEDNPIVVWHDLNHIVGILNRLAALDLPGTTTIRAMDR